MRDVILAFGIIQTFFPWDLNSLSVRSFHPGDLHVPKPPVSSFLHAF